MGKYSAVVDEIQKRLNHHAADDGILEGWKVSTDPISELVGHDDLPCVRILMPRVEERYGPLDVIRPDIEQAFLIGTRRKNGVLGLLQGVECVADALEHDTNGARDLSFGGLLMSLPTFSWRNQFVTETGLYVHLYMAVAVARLLRWVRRT